MREREKSRERIRAADRPLRRPGDLTAAIAVHAAQLPAAALLWSIASTTRDDYGSGGGGAFGVLCLLVFAPLLLPLLGMCVSVLLTVPAVLSARSAARRLGGPERLWRPAGAVATAAGWGGATLLLWHWPPGTTIPVLTALGMLPALSIEYVRTRPWSGWGLWWRSVFACAGLAVLAAGAGFLATASGLLKEYEPPKLTTAQLAGLWRGENGAELRLRPDGRAEATRLPAEPADGDRGAGGRTDHTVCAGRGTWQRDDGTHGTDRPGILLSLDGDCGLDTHWSFSGTEDAPRLFVLFGDPDAGTLRILDRTGD